MNAISSSVLFVILLFTLALVSCDKPGKLYVNGDHHSIGAEVYIDNVKVGVLKQVSISENASSGVKISSISLPVDLTHYAAEGVFCVSNGRHNLKIVTVDKQTIAKVIEQRGEGYVYIDDKKKVISE